jgi:hypothetical protein
MDAASVVALVQQVGVPVVLLVVGAVLAWRGGGKLLVVGVDSTASGATWAADGMNPYQVVGYIIRTGA